MQLATKVIDTEGKLRATLLHELCHVATWVLPPHVAKVINLEIPAGYNMGTMAVLD